MQYGYRYHDADGKVRLGEIGAPSREEAFQALKAQGVRPMQFWTIEKPDEPRPHRTRLFDYSIIRLLFILLLLGAAVALLHYFFFRTPALPHSRISAPPNSRTPAPSHLSTSPAARHHVVRPRPRHALDEPVPPAALDQLFKYRSERTLALFAEPGDLAATNRWPATIDADLWDAVEDDIVATPDDTSATLDLKRVVAGMKDDVAMRLAGGADLEEILSWLKERQTLEDDYRRRIANEDDLSPEQKNARLRALGLRTLPIPADHLAP